MAQIGPEQYFPLIDAYLAANEGAGKGSVKVRASAMLAPRTMSPPRPSVIPHMGLAHAPSW
eukprot:3579126-Prymnesium_polylepis.1